MSISDRIRDARKKAGMTQEALASYIGVTKGAIANYENGVSLPRIDLLCSLMNTLNVDANYLYQDEMMELNQNSELDITLEKIKDACSLLNDAGKEKLLGYVDDLVSSGKYAATQSFRIAARNGASHIELTQEQREKLIKAVENAGDPPAGVF